jgi:hypothetical protein
VSSPWRDCPPAISHPVGVGAIVLLLVNDHLLKSAWPGVVTGKLSDIAGMIVAPLLMLAFAELVLRRPLRTRRAVVLVCTTVAIAFAAIELVPLADELYSGVLGALQWPAHAVIAAIVDDPCPELVAVAHVADAEDLLALPGVLVAAAVAVR